LDKEILGFCTNPPYNEEGIKTFLRYGLLHFDSLGGRVFLEFGDEAIGRKLLLLQRFFTRNNLEITDIVKGVINYPFMLMHPEDHIIREKLMNFFSKELIESGYMIGADIYVLTYIPWKVGRISIKGLKIYTYL
jgi:predicted methyltransferase